MIQEALNTEKKTNLTAVDFFCSGGGMSYGMQEAGIKILAGIDFDENCRDTYEANIKGALPLASNSLIALGFIFIITFISSTVPFLAAVKISC